ncbi:MAG: zinc ribbon domain-containing protein [bacterium]|nr:zinc ribbon domain-containing protein [bacterium]
MPLFEFSCKKCGHNFEELMTLTEVNEGKAKCPACKSKRVERGFSSFAQGASGSAGGGFAGGGGGCGSGGFT